MNELEALKRKKLEMMQQQYSATLESQMQEEQQLHQQIAQLEFAMKQMMSSEALQRYGNVKLAHPEKALQALVVLAQVVQRNHGRIDDKTLKNVLSQLSNKTETRLNLHGAI